MEDKTKKVNKLLDLVIENFITELRAFEGVGINPTYLVFRVLSNSYNRGYIGVSDFNQNHSLLNEYSFDIQKCLEYKVNVDGGFVIHNLIMRSIGGDVNQYVIELHYLILDWFIKKYNIVDKIFKELKPHEYTDNLILTKDNIEAIILMLHDGLNDYGDKPICEIGVIENKDFYTKKLKQIYSVGGDIGDIIYGVINSKDVSDDYIETLAYLENTYHNSLYLDHSFSIEAEKFIDGTLDIDGKQLIERYIKLYRDMIEDIIYVIIDAGSEEFISMKNELMKLGNSLKYL